MSAINLVVAAFALFKSSSASPKVLTLETVQSWIRTRANRENYGRGYAGNTLSATRMIGFVDVLCQSTAGQGFKVTATVYFDPRQGAVATQSWTASRLDPELQKFFGRNLRVRVSV